MIAERILGLPREPNMKLSRTEGADSGASRFSGSVACRPVQRHGRRSAKAAIAYDKYNYKTILK